MSKQMLDSFKLLTTTKTYTVTKPQTTKVQTVPTVTKASTPIVTKVSDAEVKEVQNAFKTKQDSIDEMSKENSLQLQKQMDRRSKLEEAISNLMKKISDTQNSIIQNMK
jgi:septal ring factor EnvC (AmiA/AmiB activator)